MPQYWVLGASWEKNQQKKDILISRGYWYLGCSQKEKDLIVENHNQIRVGDKIAVKDTSSSDLQNGKIKAIGIVKEIDEHHKTICIDWILEEVKRENFGQGSINSLEGPFFEKEDWVIELLDLL